MITFEDIEQIICYGEKVSSEILSCENRQREIVQTRQLIFYFARHYTKESLREIGNHYGKTHGLTLLGCRKIQNYIDTERDFRNKVKDYEGQIESLKDMVRTSISEKRTEVVNILRIALMTGKPLNFEAVYTYNKLIKNEL